MLPAEAIFSLLYFVIGKKQNNLHSVANADIGFTSADVTGQNAKLVSIAHSLSVHMFTGKTSHAKYSDYRA